MLYSNTTIYAEDKEMEWGTLHRISLGEEGRGRKLITLPCPQDIEQIEKGLHDDLTVQQTKTGRPRINHKRDENLYMILSAAGGYTRRGNGTIQVQNGKQGDYKILARGNGADGAAGWVGYWDCMVLQAPLSNAVIRVRTSGSGYGTPSDIYIIHEAAVYHCTPETVEELCETLGIDIPEGIVAEDGDMLFEQDAWAIL